MLSIIYSSSDQATCMTLCQPLENYKIIYDGVHYLCADSNYRQCKIILMNFNTHSYYISRVVLASIYYLSCVIKLKFVAYIAKQEKLKKAYDYSS